MLKIYPNITLLCEYKPKLSITSPSHECLMMFELISSMIVIPFLPISPISLTRPFIRRCSARSIDGSISNYLQSYLVASSVCYRHLGVASREINTAQSEIEETDRNKDICKRSKRSTDLYWRLRNIVWCTFRLTTPTFLSFLVQIIS